MLVRKFLYIILITALAIPCFAQLNETKKSEYWMLKRYKGEDKIDTREAPDWWLSRPDDVEKYLRSLDGVEVFEIARSAGGRPIIAAAWGERENLPGRTSKSLASAISGGSLEAFYGKGKRKRQSFVFLGAAHGTEFEGTVAALNFLNVVVTGRDLKGREWPRMSAEGRKLRIVIIPFFNIDGRERYRELQHFIGVDTDDQALITMGKWKSGEQLFWPKSKLHWPMPVNEVDWLGSYFNDAGVNLVYDCGFGAPFQPETKGLSKFLREEMPECVLCSHSNSGTLVIRSGRFMPERYSYRIGQIAAVVGTRCFREGMKKYRVHDKIYEPSDFAFYQTDMIFQTCGALSFVVEFPYGYQNNPDNYDDILDIGMYTVEEIVAFGTTYGFKPGEIY